MDVASLITDTKARFAHNSAKEYLREKYSNKFFVADQGGLWKADNQTISMLQAFTTEKLILIDTHNNPVEVDRQLLLEKLTNVYNLNMSEFYKEWKELENKR